MRARWYAVRRETERVMSIAAALARTGDISMRDRLVLGIKSSSTEWADRFPLLTIPTPQSTESLAILMHANDPDAR